MEIHIIHLYMIIIMYRMLTIIIVLICAAGGEQPGYLAASVGERGATTRSAASAAWRQWILPSPRRCSW